MTDLQSCYFCSRPVDTGTQSVRSDHVEADEPVTVTLCPTCREKLDRVLDAVLPTLPGDAQTDEKPGDGSEDSDGLLRSRDTSIDALDPGDSDEDQAEPRDAETSAAAKASGASAMSGANEDETTSISGKNEDETVTTSELHEDETATAAETPEAASTPHPDETSVTPETYNRVVRLLRNREFPVDRAEFEALAAGAYEIDPSAVSEALDFAIEKGLLEERNGELRRPA